MDFALVLTTYKENKKNYVNHERHQIYTTKGKIAQNNSTNYDPQLSHNIKMSIIHLEDYNPKKQPLGNKVQALI